MEEKKTNKKLSLIIMLSTIVVLCGVFAGLCVSGVMPVLTKHGFVSLETALMLKDATSVSDEETLRELLLMEEDMEIVLKKDIEITDTFSVKGNKTLYGDATIKMDIAGLFEQRSILSVGKGAHLTMNGLVLDGGGMADGVEVRQNGELTYLSGRVQYTRYGITSHGKVTVEDIDVEHIGTAGIYASFKSKVYVKGGTLRDSYANLLNVETGGYMEVYEGVLATDSIGVGVVNAGSLRLYGGEISHTGGHGIENKGDLITEYKGKEKDGYIFIHNTKRRAINVNTSDDTVIKDLFAQDIGSNAIYVTDKVTQGKLTMEHCKFDHCGITDGNTFSFSSKVTVKDITAINAGKGGLYVRSGAKVTAQDITIENCNGIGLEIIGTFTGKDITIDGAAKHGLAVGFQDDVMGYAEITNVTMSNVEQNNIVIRKGASATVIDSTLNKCKRTGIYVTEGGSLVLDGTKVLGVKDDRLNCINMEPNTTVTLKGDGVVTGSTNRAIKVNDNATLNMEGGTICDVNADVSGPAVGLVEAGATFNMSGGTIQNCTTAESSGAVYVEKGATFNMTGGTISGNTAKKSGGASQVRGVMNMSGGVIEKNEAGTNGGGLNAGANAEQGIYGKIVITGGTIQNNKSHANGGGVSVSGGTVATITGGTIKGNTAKGIGNGIYTNGDVTLGKDVYIKDNEIELNEASVTVKIAGSKLNKHSEKDPIYIIPDYELAQQGVVAVCDSADAANAIVTSVKAGNEAYSFYASDKNIVSNVLKADMDMAGADKVVVSSYEQLKEAVESTTDKRYVVIAADIAIEKVITVPQGTTVCIKDDGSVRRLTRTSKLDSNFFRTYYGTGLYVTGTAYGNLILDGKATTKEANEPILRVRGTTEVRNVVFENNYTAGDGAFIRHHYGELSVYTSSFTNGKAASAAGAVKVVAGKAYFEGASFTDNYSTKSGGAIKVEDVADAKVELVSCHFTNNTAGTLGGAINAAGGKLNVTDTTFADNKANGGKAGAVSATDCVAVFNGNGSFTGNTSTEEAGAVYVNRAKLTMSGYDFTGNKADRGGAIYVGGSGENDVNEIADCTFLNNAAIGNPEKGNSDDTSGKGGAIFNSTKTTKITNCTFGAKDNGNTANSNGGALYIASGALVELNGTNDNAVFAYNTTLTDGGAICVGSGNLKLNGYKFKKNTAKNAGAIQFNNSKIAGTIAGCTFESNRATSAHGGAVKVNVTSNNGSKVVITASTFGGEGLGNTAKKNGGAIWLAEKATTEITASAFVGNSVSDNDNSDTDINRGGAIFSDGAMLTIADTTFKGNSAKMRGAAVYSGNEGTLVLTGTGDKALFENNESAKGGAAIGSGSGIVSVSGYQFKTNTSKNDGGAIWLDTKVVAEITDSEFTDNQTIDGGGSGDDRSRGGAIFNNGAALTLVDTKFEGNKSFKNGGVIFTGKDGVLSLVGNDMMKALVSGNSSSADGGAICVGSGTLNINGYAFSGNKGKYGGAIRINNGTGIVVDIQDSVFDGNRADNNQGGAIYNASKDAGTVIRITDSKIMNSYSKASGGAIYNQSSQMIFRNTTFEKNEGSVGGAINHAGGKLTAVNCHFIENKARTGSEGGGAIIMSGGATLILKGNGSFKRNTSGNAGGAIYIGGAQTTETVHITGHTFEENSATTDGGAIYMAAYGNLTTTNCIFVSNKANGKSGGAVYIAKEGKMIANGCNFTSNTSKTSGGAVYVNEAQFEFDGCKFLSNTGTSNGGVIYTLRATVKGKNSEFTSNKVSAATGNGGAIRAEESTFELEKCTFKSNETKQDGGAVDLFGTKATMKNCKFESQKAGRHGGAINVHKKNNSILSELYMNDCDVVSNTASGGDGGGVRLVESTTAIIEGGTFSGNTCSGLGEGLHFGSGALTVKGVKFTQNKATSAKSFNANAKCTIENCIFDSSDDLTYKTGSTLKNNTFLDEQ